MTTQDHIKDVEQAYTEFASHGQDTGVKLALAVLHLLEKEKQREEYQARTRAKREAKLAESKDRYQQWDQKYGSKKQKLVYIPVEKP
jgi:hypothetical protein